MSFDLLGALRALFSDATRLYRLKGDGPLSGLLVESWVQHDALDQPWVLHISALSSDAALDPQAMLGQRLTLLTRLADGSEHPRSGIVTAAQAEEADGGFARYRLTVEAWLGLLTHSRRSQVWQERSVTDIVESVFAAYPQAAWRWANCVGPHLAESANAGVRSHTVQYRETDLAFVQRLLAREGIAWRFENADDAPLGHRLVLFADSVSRGSCSEDAVSASGLFGRGVRFHASGAIQGQDAVQALGGLRRLPVATTTTLAWDYKAKRAVASSVPTAAAYGGANAPALEDYDDAGAYAFADTQQAERSARLMQQAHEARHKSWLGRSTVRSFTAGQWFQLTGSDLDLLQDLSAAKGQGKGEDDRRFLLTSVTHAGINNLPKTFSAAVAEQLGHAPLGELDRPIDPAVRAQAVATGYGNAFEAIRAQVPWRPQLIDDTGARRHVKPSAQGMLTATVVGPDGQAQASGADEIHTDRLGRVRVRFDFQTQSQGPNTAQSSTWVRMLQRWAGNGMGAQFIPRIGQEVLVDFVNGDIERPLIVGALYNGQGEAGSAPTPGGLATEADASALKQSTDHRPGAQGNLANGSTHGSTGGHSPAWHGAGPDELTAGGQRNAAALSGYKTQEFGGTGYNQLVFDDSNGQLRTQLATTQHATQLNLGHLIHQADNHRGSFRGLGFELRTDAYGAVRAGRGLLLSTYATQASEPAGDNTAGLALQGQLKTLAQTFNQAAATHQTVQLAQHLGSTQAGRSALSNQQPPAQALHTALKGMVDAQAFGTAQGDAAAKNVTASTGAGSGQGSTKLPHSTDPILAIAAKAGLGQVAGQDVQWSAGEGIVIASGQDTQLATGGASRIHTGQAIGILAGAVQPGDQAQGKGLTLIAGQGDIDIQAQSDTLQVAAQKDLSIQSQNAHIDWAAAKRIVLATAGGASVTLEGGNITVECPGKITIRASQKSFVGPERITQDMPEFPRGTLLVPMQVALSSAPVSGRAAWAGMPYKLYANGGLVKEGVVDEGGAISLLHSPAIQDYKVELANGMKYQLPVVDAYRNAVEGPLAAQGIFKGEAGPGSSESRIGYMDALKGASKP